MNNSVTTGQIVKWTVYSIVALILFIALLFGGVAGCKGFNRYQKRADVTNNIKIQRNRLKLYDLKIRQAIKLAEVKKQTAIGQKKANIEIAKRLTPLFVQYEMIQALEQIAASGRNNSVIYIPSGANGVPLIAPTGQQVYGGASVPTK